MTSDGSRSEDAKIDNRDDNRDDGSPAAVPGALPAESPGFRESFAAAARKSGIGKVAPGEAPSSGALLEAMGGIRGLIESILPGLAFLVLFTVTQQLVVSVVVPVVIAVGFVVARVLTRQPWTSAVAGVIGIALSAGLALFTGRSEDNFVWGFIINGVALVVLVASLLARRPLIGVIGSLITGEGSAWRESKPKFRVALIATILWIGLFSLRLGVELPLYFAGDTSALATVKLVLGLPLYAGLLWVTWLLMRTAYSRPTPAQHEPAADDKLS